MSEKNRPSLLAGQAFIAVGRYVAKSVENLDQSEKSESTGSTRVAAAERCDWSATWPSGCSPDRGHYSR